MSNYPVTLEVAYPEKLSRGTLILRALFGGIYVGVPHGFCLIFYAIASVFVRFVAWWAVLFTGKYPRGMFEFNVGLTRWGMRVVAYMNFFTDVYPPFNGKP